MVIRSKLHKLAENNGYIVEYKPTRRVRGWPEKSQKPFGLYYTDGTHIASFATEEALERNLRGRAGC